MNCVIWVMEFNGNVKICQLGMLILGECVKVNLNEKQLDVMDMEYVIYQIYVYGSVGCIYNLDD